MTVPTPRASATTTDELPAVPTRREVIARVAVSLAIAVIAPAVLLWVMLAIFSVASAVIAALVWMMGAVSWRWTTGRPVSGLLLLTVRILTLKTAFTLARATPSSTLRNRSW